MWSLRDYLPVRGTEPDAAMRHLLRSRKAGLDDSELRASIAGAWRRIEQKRLPRRRRAAADGLLHRLLVPSLALLCFLCGLWIGLSLEPGDVYGSIMSDLASHPLIADLAP